MVKHRNEIILAFLFIGTFIAASLIYLRPYEVQIDVPQKPQLAVEATDDNPGLETSSVIVSPDEKFSLTLKNTPLKDDRVKQSAFITGGKENKTVLVFEKVSKKENIISVPFNTFSPNDKFIFLEYPEADSIKYIVIKTDGEGFGNDIEAVEVNSLFYEKFPEFVISEVTGWGGYNVLIVNSDTKEGKTGPSWWFDMTNMSFIKLSTRFN